MKILQLNIWGGRLGKQIIEVLRREQADIVCLQEAIELKGNGFIFDNLEQIQNGAEYQYSFFTPALGFNIMKRHAKFGLAILSNVPFEEKHSTQTGLEYIDNFDFDTTSYNVRAIQHVVVKEGETSVNIINHHGHHIPSHKNGDQETLRQCKLIADYVQKLEGPTVLCGDFNLIPESESLEQINKVLINLPKERGIITTRTALTHKTEVCDYIFTSPDLQVKNFQVLDDVASDHKALTVELLF